MEFLLQVFGNYMKIMRQQESKQFAEMLNRLREGNQSNEDIMKFKERILTPSSTNYPIDAPHLFIHLMLK